MLILISPSTTMEFESVYENFNINSLEKTSPHFINESCYLVELLKSMDINSFKSTLNLSDDLTKLNYDRYQNFALNNSLQSILAFQGEVFSNINVSTFDMTDLNYLNNHLRIFSGLYGFLKPFDNIKPYRLEMKTKLENESGANLYNFWKEKLTNYLINECKNTNTNHLVNLASNEYMKCLDTKLIKSNIKLINIEFKEYYADTDKYKVIGMYSKQARGQMVRFITLNKIDNLEDLKSFNINDYSYNTDLSDENNLIFTRHKK